MVLLGQKLINYCASFKGKRTIIIIMSWVVMLVAAPYVKILLFINLKLLKLSESEDKVAFLIL